MKVSKMTEKQKKLRSEELNKSKKERKLTRNEALDSIQIKNNWSEKERNDFAECIKDTEKIIM